jgi:uncharacterized DUF497 family protein
MSHGFHYQFEWDPKKARANLRKHEVSFEQATTVFKDPLTLTIYDEDEGEGEREERWVTLGRSETGPLLAVVHT